jgi:transcriptional antiterminator RfaH
LARTKPMSEYVAATALERNGYELYFPRVKTPRPRYGHTDAPLFPGYLFVHQVHNGSGLPAIQRMAGMLGWVKFDDEVPKVPDEVISELEQRLEAINSGGGLWARYRRGEQVRVAMGAMEGLAEVLEEPRSPQSRVRILLSFMGRMVPARVHWSDLRPTNQGSGTDYGGRPPRRTRGRGRWIRGFGPRAGTDVSSAGG